MPECNSGIVIRMKKVKWIIFDLGGVLIDWKPALASVGECINYTPEKVLEAIDNNKINLDTGRLKPNSFWTKLIDSSNTNASPKTLERAWIEYHFAIEPVWEYLPTLISNYKLGLMTNMWTDYLEKIEKKNNKSSSMFEQIFDSSKVKLRKPSIEIYQFAEKQLNSNGNSIFFIDDSIENINSAKSLGWETFHFDTKEPEEEVNKLNKLLS